MLALLGTIISAPIIALLVLLIKRDSEGPGIFRQVRVGRNGKPFVCYKLRTMSQDAPNVPTHDSRSSSITRIGRWLRATKADELPQLWNVLMGQMSFVGPRPCLPTQVELIEERRKRGVLELRPGITGLAQINDIDMSDPVRLAKVDADYVAKRTFALDMKILVRTVTGGGQGDKVRL